MKFPYLFAWLCLGCAGLAHGEIYKYVDRDGNVTYSSTPLKGGKKLDLPPLPTMAPFNPKEFPQVDHSTQKRRDEARRKILEDELATEEKQLTEARLKLQNVENNPQAEGVKSAQEDVTLHEKNVEALKNELSRVK